MMFMPLHRSFDICEDTGGAAKFFPSGQLILMTDTSLCAYNFAGHGALTGTFTEVSCSQWSGSDGGPLWNGACLDGENAANWPSVACGNKGEHSLPHHQPKCSATLQEPRPESVSYAKIRSSSLKIQIPYTPIDYATHDTTNRSTQYH